MVKLLKKLQKRYTQEDEIIAAYNAGSARKLEDPKAKIQAHADYIHDMIDTFGHDVDIMLEAKQKELALLEYRKKDSIFTLNN